MTEDAFSDFFAAHFSHIWHFAVRRTGSGAEADDIAAETFAVAWRRRHDIPRDGGDRMWLFGVARLVLSNQRRSAARQFRLHEKLIAEHDPVAPEPAVPDPVVFQALAALSEDDRELLLLRCWDGLDVADIAVLLRIRPAKVSSRLHKAKAKLRRELDRRDPDAVGQVMNESHAERSRP